MKPSCECISNDRWQPTCSSSNNNNYYTLHGKWMLHDVIRRPKHRQHYMQQADACIHYVCADDTYAWSMSGSHVHCFVIQQTLLWLQLSHRYQYLRCMVEVGEETVPNRFWKTEPSHPYFTIRSTWKQVFAWASIYAVVCEGSTTTTQNVSASHAEPYCV